MTKLFGFVAGLALLASFPVQVDAAFSLDNGGFQAPVVSPPFSTIGVGSGLTDWTVTTGSIDLLNTYQGRLGALGTTQYIDLAGNSPGAITQGLTGLVSGQQYTVTYYYSRNPDNNASPTPPSWATGEVSIIGGPADPFTYTGTITFNSLGWTKGLFNFIASSSTATLQFSSEAASGPFGAFLDEVSIAATPEPTTLVVWSGLAAIGGFVAYRRRTAA